MKPYSVAIFLFALLLGSGHVIAQIEVDPTEENWMAPLGLFSDYRLLHRFDLYSKEDIENFKRRVAEVRAATTEDEWEGMYFREDIGSVYLNQLTWSKSAGYFSFGIETCYPELRSIKVGRVVSNHEFVQFLPNKPSRNSARYIKVRWGHRRYLVAEDSLAAFLKKAVGLYVEPENNEDKNYQLWSNYWLALDDDKDPQPSGLPVVPSRFKHLAKSPIVSKLTAVGPRRIRSDFQHGWTVYGGKSVVYEITLSDGARAGLLKGMRLQNATSEETVYITRVTQTKAIGELVRALDDETGSDHCLNDEAEKIECPTLRKGDVYSTPVGQFWNPFL